MDIQQFLRQRIILDEVNKGNYPTLNYMKEKIDQMYDYYNLILDKQLVGGSKSTLTKDMDKIRKFFGIGIEYSPTQKGYYIERHGGKKPMIEELLESLNLFYLINNQNDINQYIAIEPRKSKVGITHFFELLAAIRDGKKVQFIYNYYSEKEPAFKKVSPLGLKEFKGFWYLVAKEGENIKSYGLDRITELAKITEKSDYPADFNLDDYFKHCYGIVKFDDQEPEKILIKVKPIKAAYYKANPLHPSQKIEIETEEYTLISLFVYFNYDLKQELRSHAPGEVELIQPKADLNNERYF